MRAWWSHQKPKLLGSLIYYVARLLGMTLRVKVEGEEKLQQFKGGKIIAGWHGRSFIPAILFRNRGYWALISLSRDGEMQNTIFRKLGFNVIRGSTNRGGARAAAECAKELKTGATFAMTPDGPRGPSEVVQRGIVWLAKKGRSAIFPTAISARPRKLISSWDRYMVPYPFAICLVKIGDPVCVPEDASEELQETIRLEVENKIKELQKIVEAEMGYA